MIAIRKPQLSSYVGVTITPVRALKLKKTFLLM